MRNSNANSRPSLILQIIFTYFGVICCFKKHHIRRTRNYCKKGCEWICPLCDFNTYSLHYLYITSNGSFTYCVCHYQMHFKILIHYWNNITITIFDPITLDKKGITLDKTINSNAESISAGGKVFVCGGCPATSEMYEVDFKRYKLLQKNDMFYKKYAHTLSYFHGSIYSIGGYQFAYVIIIGKLFQVYRQKGCERSIFF